MCVVRTASLSASGSSDLRPRGLLVDGPAAGSTVLVAGPFGWPQDVCHRAPGEPWQHYVCGGDGLYWYAGRCVEVVDHYPRMDLHDGG